LGTQHQLGYVSLKQKCEYVKTKKNKCQSKYRAEEAECRDNKLANQQIVADTGSVNTVDEQLDSFTDIIIEILFQSLNNDEEASWRPENEKKRR